MNSKNYFVLSPEAKLEASFCLGLSARLGLAQSEAAQTLRRSIANSDWNPIVSIFPIW